MLLGLVSEDGKGSARVSCSRACIGQYDIIAHIISHRGCLGKHFFHGVTEGLPNGKEFRCAAYYTGMLRIVRSVVAIDTAASKTVHRAYVNMLSALAALVPSSPIQDKQEAEHSMPHPSVHPDKVTLQRTQLLLDLRVSSRVLNFFSCEDLSIVKANLGLCHKVLSFCGRMCDDEALEEPYASLALDFSTTSWVHSIAEIIGSKKHGSELISSSVQCLVVMTKKKAWVRAWAVCDVLSLLAAMVARASKEVSGCRADALLALKLSVGKLPAGIHSLLSRRVPGVASIPGSSGPEPISNLLVEANDLSFGSTLKEQAKFTVRLECWIMHIFPEVVPLDGHPSFEFVCQEGEALWSPLLQLTTLMISWLPKLCLALEINNREGSARDKMILSCSVAIRQIDVVGRVLLYALHFKYPGAVTAVIDALWLPDR